MRRTIDGKISWQLSVSPNKHLIVSNKNPQPNIRIALLQMPLKIFCLINASIDPNIYNFLLEDHLRMARISGASEANDFELIIACAGSAEDAV